MARTKQNLQKLTQQEHKALFEKGISETTLKAIMEEFNFVVTQLVSVELLAKLAENNDVQGAQERMKIRRRVRAWLKKLGLSNDAILVIQLGAKAKMENDLKG